MQWIEESINKINTEMHYLNAPGNEIKNMIFDEWTQGIRSGYTGAQAGNSNQRWIFKNSLFVNKGILANESDKKGIVYEDFKDRFSNSSRKRSLIL